MGICESLFFPFFSKKKISFRKNNIKKYIHSLLKERERELQARRNEKEKEREKE